MSRRPGLNFRRFEHDQHYTIDQELVATFIWTSIRSCEQVLYDPEEKATDNQTRLDSVFDMCFLQDINPVINESQ